MEKHVLEICLGIILKPRYFYTQHFLSYLNSLRVREYCTAFHNLFHYFDRNITLTAETAQQESSQKLKTKEKAVCRRYAALNLAALHYRFGHR